jgi:hypothetical protein
MKIRRVEAELFYAAGWTDSHDEANSRFFLPGNLQKDAKLFLTGPPRAGVGPAKGFSPALPTRTLILSWRTGWVKLGAASRITCQYSETNVMHFLLLRIKGLYMFRTLLAYPQEVLHKRHLVYCVRVMSVGYYQDWSGTGVFDSSTPILVEANWHNTHAIYQMLFV